MPNFSPNPDLLSCLKPIDYIVFSLILLATLLIVILGQNLQNSKKGKKDFLDYMLMGRSLTLPMFTMTLVATWYGGIFGVTEIAFESGLFNFITQGIFWYLTYLIFAFFLVKKVKSFDVLTLPELAGKLFGPKAKNIAAIFNFFNVVPITYTISLGILIQTITGLELYQACLLGVLFSCAYSMIGGFRAIVLSDILQFFIMCGSVTLVFYMSVYTFGFSILFEKLPSSHFSLTGKSGLLSTFAWGFIALSTLVDPNFYQRCFAAKNEKTAKKGILLATMIWFCFDLCTTFGAMYAAAIIPTANSKSAYLSYSLQLLSPGLRGFFLAGIVATILSTIDSYLFIASNTLCYDLAPKRFKENLLFNKLGVLSTGLLSVSMAVVFSGSIKAVWKTLGSYSAGCLLVPMILGGFCDIRISDKAFTLSTLSSATSITLWHMMGITIFDDLYIGLIISLLCLAYSKTYESNSRKQVS